MLFDPAVAPADRFNATPVLAKQAKLTFNDCSVLSAHSEPAAEPELVSLHGVINTKFTMLNLV